LTIDKCTLKAYQEFCHDLSFSESKRNYNDTPDDGRLTKALWSVTCVCRQRQEYLSLFPALVISYYANLKGLKVELGSDRLFGIPLDVYIPLEQVAIQVNTDSEKIDILKEHLCKQRGIKLIKLPMKPNEAESEYAQRIKAAFQSVHIFISSDTEEDVKIIRKIFKNWRNSR